MARDQAKDGWRGVAVGHWKCPHCSFDRNFQRNKACYKCKRARDAGGEATKLGDRVKQLEAQLLAKQGELDAAKKGGAAAAADPGSGAAATDGANIGAQISALNDEIQGLEAKRRLEPDDDLDAQRSSFIEALRTKMQKLQKKRNDALPKATVLARIEEKLLG